MADDISDLIFPAEPNRPDPRAAARATANRPLPRRFFTLAEPLERDGGFCLALDGRTARTPAKSLLQLPTRAAAELVAAEWNAQGEQIDPFSMPVTRLANAAIDGVAQQRDAVATEIAGYGASDLLCYRASDPERLVERQAAAWDPVLEWASEMFGARFILAEGVVFVHQPPASVEAIAAAVLRFDDPFGLAALSTMTSLTGSVLLPLAVAHGRLSTAEAWASAHVDEDFQMEVWGQDDEALARRVRRWTEMQAAAALLHATRSA